MCFSSSQVRSALQRERHQEPPHGSSRFSSSQVRSALQPKLGSDTVKQRLGFSSSQVRSALQHRNPSRSHAEVHVCFSSSQVRSALQLDFVSEQFTQYAEFQFLSGSISTSTEPPHGSSRQKCFSSSQVRSALQRKLQVDGTTPTEFQFLSGSISTSTKKNSMNTMIIIGFVSVPLRFDQHFNFGETAVAMFRHLWFQFLSGSISTSTWFFCWPLE